MSYDASAALFDLPVLQALLDVMPGTLHVNDHELRYQVVNRYYAEQWNMRVDEFIGHRATELFGHASDGEVEERDRDVLATGKALPFYREPGTVS